jgi:hypothetical protein
VGKGKIRIWFNSISIIGRGFAILNTAFCGHGNEKGLYFFRGLGVGSGKLDLPVESVRGANGVFNIMRSLAEATVCLHQAARM